MSNFVLIALSCSLQGTLNYLNLNYLNFLNYLKYHLNFFVLRNTSNVSNDLCKIED